MVSEKWCSKMGLFALSASSGCGKHVFLRHKLNAAVLASSIYIDKSANVRA